MEVASQGRVGSQGGGEATVFDTSQFYTQMYNMQKDIVTEREKKRKEYEQQQATWNALLEDPGDVWQSDYEYVNKAVNEYNDFIIDLRSKGIDPETMDSSLMRKMKQLESEIRRATSAAKDNETYYNQSFNILNQDKTSKYNKDYATSWLKDYSDPSKTPQDRARMRNESNPFKLNYNLIELVDDTMPDATIEDKGRTKITYYDKNAHKAIILGYVTGDPEGQEVFESLKENGETEDMFAERVAELGQKKYPAKTDVQPPPSRGGGGGGNGDGTKKDKNKISVVGQNKIPDARWSQDVPVNKLTLDKNPGIYAYSNRVINEDGTAEDKSIPVMNFVPQDGFYIGPGGNVTAIGYGASQDGKLVNVEVDYDFNKGNFEAAGYPNMFDAFRGIAGGATTTTTGGETLAERMRKRNKS